MIRSAAIDSLPVLMDIEHRCFLRDQFSEALYTGFLLRPDCEVYLYHLAGKQPIGSMVLLFPAEMAACHVISVAVLPEHQGHGFGRELMAWAEARALAKQCRQLQLEVRRNNRRARAIYEALDYKRIRVLKDYYGKGVDGILYIKALPECPAL